MLAIVINTISSLSIGGRVQRKPELLEISDSETGQNFATKFDQSDLLKAVPHELAVSLINSWFNAVAYPMILNRTQMIKNYCENRYDPILYAAVFARVLYKLGIPIFNQTQLGIPGSLFMEYALALLDRDPHKVTLTRLQGVYILGDNLIHSGQVKKGLTLMLMAGKMIFELQIHKQDSVYFNQQLDPIERELRNNIRWAMHHCYIWGSMLVRSRIDKMAVLSHVKLPVKNENESALYALDKKNGLATQEIADAIRTFYSSSYLTEILLEIWLNFSPSSGLASVISTENGGATDSYSSLKSIQLLYERDRLHDCLRDRLRGWMSIIPSDLAPLNTAEILLCLNILYIHSYFPKTEDSVLVFLEESEISECIASADAIIHLTKLVLKDPNGQELHPIVTFGLNTCASINFLFAGSGSPTQRKEAIAKLRNIVYILEFFQLAAHDDQLIDQLRDMISLTKQSESTIISSEQTEQGSKQTMVPVVIPRISLDSIVNREHGSWTKNSSEPTTLLTILMK
ncbi:uncharacterized protein VTP21DRAFT_9921 [Calcarisporiella thermophila]|uniref:uncharacterized protein n=1 Tax=Calcarisporiella thermophila TaxID=911321 RepID=UPI00374343A5